MLLWRLAVPDIALTPEKRFLFLPTLNKAVGSTFLGLQGRPHTR